MDFGIEDIINVVSPEGLANFIKEKNPELYYEIGKEAIFEIFVMETEYLEYLEIADKDHKREDWSQ
jgi:hypothetical protein